MITLRNTASAANAAGFEIDLPVPAGVQAGDFMIAHVTYRQGSASLVTIPSGWTLLRKDSVLADSGGVTGILCTKIASSSEPATYQFTFGDFRLASGGIVAYSGVKNATPFDIHDVSTVENTTTPTSPSIGTVYAAPLLLWFLAARDNASGDTATVPAGMTQRWRSNAPSPGCVSLFAELAFSGPGSSGTKVGALSPAANAVTQVLFLNPADENPNHPPQANAGSDVATEVGVGVVLDGSASTDSDAGDDITYAWTHISGPNGIAQLSDTAIASPTFTPVAAGMDVFRLTVTDESSVTDTDDVSASTTPAGISVALASGTGDSMEASLPATAAAGDLAIFAMITRPFSQSIELSGWAAVHSAIGGSSSTDVALWVFARRLEDDDLGQTITATMSDAVGTEWTAHVIVIRDMHPDQLFNKSISAIPLASPTSFGNSVVGGAGSATYTYTFTASDAAGETIPVNPTSTQTITNAPNTLSPSNYVKLLWQPTARATSYRVYGRTGGSQKLLATIVDPQNEVPDEFYFIYHDVGDSPGSDEPPTQQPIGWVADGLNLDGGGVPRPERLFTTYANGRVLLLAAGQLGTGNPSVTVDDPVGTSPITTTTSPNGKMVLHSAIKTLGAAGNAGTYVFTPSDFTASWATVALTLRPEGANGAPTAIAGFDQDAAIGSTVYLDASQSYDEDGDTLTYQWEQTSGPDVILSSATALFPAFTMPEDDVTFDLTVTDPDGLADTDSVTITKVKAGHYKVLNSSEEWISL